MRILILAAFQDELTHILHHFQLKNTHFINKCRCWTIQWEGYDTTLSLTGIGTNAAAITTTLLCENLQPDLIIFCGSAGGLKSDQQIGDLVLATQIIEIDLYLSHKILIDTPYKNALTDPHTLKAITTQYALHDSMSNVVSSIVFERLKLGTVVTSNTFPSPKSLFAEIKSLDCDAIDMESAGAFKAAQYYDIPILALRAISNLLDEAGNDLGTKPDALAICSAQLASGVTHILQHLKCLKANTDLKNQQKILELITRYELLPHPEGGWYRRTFYAKDFVKAEHDALARYAGESRPAGSSILYLLEQNDFSAWHQLQSDETWSFHTGDSLLLRIIEPASEKLKEIKLGLTESHLQFTIPAGHIFSAESLGRFSLVGCTVTPGFDFKDFKLITAEEFSYYPQHATLSRLIRGNSQL